MDLITENTLKTITEISEPEREYEPDMAYPQYKHRFEGAVISTDDWIKLQEEVWENLNDRLHALATPEVKRHWQMILAGFVPFGMRIVRPLKNDEDYGFRNPIP